MNTENLNYLRLMMHEEFDAASFRAWIEIPMNVPKKATMQFLDDACRDFDAMYMCLPL